MAQRCRKASLKRGKKRKSVPRWCGFYREDGHRAGDEKENGQCEAVHLFWALRTGAKALGNERPKIQLLLCLVETDPLERWMCGVRKSTRCLIYGPRSRASGREPRFCADVKSRSGGATPGLRNAPIRGSIRCSARPILLICAVSERSGHFLVFRVTSRAVLPFFRVTSA